MNEHQGYQMMSSIHKLHFQDRELVEMILHQSSLLKCPRPLKILRSFKMKLDRLTKMERLTVGKVETRMHSVDIQRR